MKWHRYVMGWVVMSALTTQVVAAPNGLGWYNTAPTTLTLQAVPSAPPTGFAQQSARTTTATRNSVADQITPEIATLAQGLHHAPLRIYAYVKHRIAYEHYHGAKKGALLTLLEGKGNDFDQAALLVALLRAAGYEAQYQYGYHRIDYRRPDGNDLIHWLGLSPTAYAHLSWTETLAQFNLDDPWPHIADEQRKKNILYALIFLGSRGSPQVYYEANATQVLLQRVWVSVAVEGTAYHLDPSLKQQQAIPGIDLEAASGYSRDALLQAIGGLTTSTSVRGLDEQALANQLTAYTGQLIQHLKQHAPQATPIEITGGMQPLTYEITSLENQLVHDVWGTVETWDAIPAPHIATLRLQFASLDLTLDLPALQGQKLALTFEGNTAQLWLGDTLMASAHVPEASFALTLSVDHPHPGDRNDQSVSQTYNKQDAYAYVILYGYCPSGRRLRRAQQQLDVYLRDAQTAYPHLASGHLDWRQLPEVPLK